MKLQQVGALSAFEVPSGHRVRLTRTPGGALWAAVYDGVLYFRWEHGATPTAEDGDRWLALVGSDDWGTSHSPLF